MSQEIIEGYRLSPQQRRLWLLRQSDRCAQCAVRIDGELHVDVLEEAVRHVASQQESLRTTFKLLTGMTIPVQVISDRPDVLFQRHELRQLTAEQQHSRVKLIFDDIARRNIAYDRPPLLHCDLIDLSPSKYDLIISLPVACADAPSLHCLVHQIAHAYQAVLQSEKPLPIETMQYADFSEWQNELLEAQGGLAGQYWRQQSLTELAGQKLSFEQLHLRADAREHFGRLERLRDEVDAARFEAFQFLRDLFERGDEHDRNRGSAGARLEMRAHFVAVHLRHLHVEKNDVG